MARLSPHRHGVLDYATVAAFALAPPVLGFRGLPAGLAYGLAAVHLALTLLTRFPLGAARVVPFRTHGVVEFVVGVALVLVALVPGFTPQTAARVFFGAMGVVVLAVWAATSYRAEPDAAR